MCLWLLGDVAKQVCGEITETRLRKVTANVFGGELVVVEWGGGGGGGGGGGVSNREAVS